MKVRQSANPLLKIFLLGFLFTATSTTLWAQEPAEQPAQQEPSTEMREDFSDDELKSFVKANEKVTVIQMEAEQTMVKAIEGEGLTVERFNELLEQQRDPSRKEGEASAEELESFNSAAQMILEENTRIEQQMTSSIEEEGIDIETYKQIMVAYQQNPDVQTRVNNFVKTDN